MPKGEAVRLSMSANSAAADARISDILAAKRYRYLLCLFGGNLKSGKHIVGIVESLKLRSEPVAYLYETVGILGVVLQLKRIEAAEPLFYFFKSFGVGSERHIVVGKAVADVGHFRCGPIQDARQARGNRCRR